MRALVVFLISLLSCTSWAGDRLCDEIKISAHPDNPPFSWHKNGSLTGASLTISKEIFERLGVKTKVDYQGPWTRVLKKVQQGEVDFVPVIKKTSERKAYFVFTDNYFSPNPIAIFVRDDLKRKIRGLPDLIALSGISILGERHGLFMDSFVRSSPSVDKVLDMVSGFEMLKMRRTDFLIGSLISGNMLLRTKGLRNDIKVAHIYDRNWVYSGFSKHSNCQHLVNAFAKKLQQYKESGDIQNKIKEYERRWLAAKSMALSKND